MHDDELARGSEAPEDSVEEAHRGREPLDGLDVRGVREGPELEVGRVGGGRGEQEATMRAEGRKGLHGELA